MLRLESINIQTQHWEGNSFPGTKKDRLARKQNEEAIDTITRRNYRIKMQNYSPETWTPVNPQRTSSSSSTLTISGHLVTPRPEAASIGHLTTSHHPTSSVPLAHRYSTFYNNLDGSSSSTSATIPPYNDEYSAWNSFDFTSPTTHTHPHQAARSSFAAAAAAHHGHFHHHNATVMMQNPQATGLNPTAATMGVSSQHRDSLLSAASAAAASAAAAAGAVSGSSFGNISHRHSSFSKYEMQLFL